MFSIRIFHCRQNTRIISMSNYFCSLERSGSYYRFSAVFFVMWLEKTICRKGVIFNTTWHSLPIETSGEPHERCKIRTTRTVTTQLLGFHTLIQNVMKSATFKLFDFVLCWCGASPLLVQLQTLLSCWCIGRDKIKQNFILVKLIKTSHTQVAWANCCHYGEYIVNSSVFFIWSGPQKLHH